MKRALVLVALCSLAACGGKSGPEDPAIAVGTGIPVGAPNATGVRFEAPGARTKVGEDGTIEQGPVPLPKAVPDPFEPLEKPHGTAHPSPSPPEPSVVPGPLKPPKKKGVEL